MLGWISKEFKAQNYFVAIGDKHSGNYNLLLSLSVDYCMEIKNMHLHFAPTEKHRGEVMGHNTGELTLCRSVHFCL